MKSLTKKIAEYLKINDKQARMDSFMVSFSCKNLSRIELVYKVNANFIEILAKLDSESIPEKCFGYLESGHKKETIYIKVRISSSYYEEKSTYTAKFSKDDWDGCPLVFMCRISKQKKISPQYLI